MSDRPITSSPTDRAAKAAQAVIRDAKIVRLWNEGLSSAILATRFGCNQALIQDVLRDARARGETVRVSIYNSTRAKA